MTLDEAIDQVAASPEFRRLKKERDKVVNFYVGLVMKEYQSYNPQMVRRAVERHVDGVMMLLPTFEFEPHQYVIVTAHGLNYSARVCGCILRSHGRCMYEVEYAADGELKRGEFYGDQLKACPP